MEGAYRKSKGNAGLEGVHFQLDLLTVFLLNALQGYKDWKISSENEQAGKYDDLVLELSNKSVLLQAKFKQNRKISRDQLFSSNSRNADFSLAKYFFSYLDIKSEFRDNTVMVCTNTDINQKGLENVLIRHPIDPDSMLYYQGVSCQFFTFNKNILPELKTSAKAYLKENLKDRDIDETVIKDENMENFLKHFQFCSNYPSGDELRKIIDQLLSGLTDSSSCYKISHHEIYRKVESWFKQPKGEYLTKVQAKAMLCEIRSDKYCESLKDYNVSFERNDFNFTDSKRIFHVKTEGKYLLQLLKIVHALQDDKSRILYVNPSDDMEMQKEIIEAFKLRPYVFLLIIWNNIEDETLTLEISGKLKEILEKFRYKKVILVADSNNRLIEQIGLKDIMQCDGFIRFEDLSKDSRERLLKDKNVVFQGRKISLDELLETQMTDDYNKFLDSDIVEKLVRGEEIKVGVRPVDLNDDIARYYVRRSFKREIRDSRRRNNVILEENICYANEKVILITDSAGTGKSTVLTTLSISIKDTSPHLWVIKINLNDYTVILRDTSKENRKMISVLELLNSQESTKLTNRFEEQVFSMNGKVVLMLDGVDEISPDYTSLILGLLGQCQKAPNFGKIFVTTRPHITRELKAVLHVGSYKLLPFTRRNQANFLTNYWTHNLQLDETDRHKCKRYAETLVTKMPSWVNPYHYYLENSFAAVPLQVKMLAEVFQENIRWGEAMDWEGCKEYLKTNNVKPKLPEKINIARLYDMFIRKKRDVFIDKGNPIGNMAANHALIHQFEESLAHHRNLALHVILRESERDLFSGCHVGRKDTEECMLKIGIVQRSAGKFQFVHRTFAEYFLAECIVTVLKQRNVNAEFQRFLINVILVRPEFRVVRAFLDKFLQKVEGSLSSNIFKNYQMTTYKNDSNDNPIFVLAREGWVRILQLILKSINFKIIRDNEINIKNWRVKIAIKKRNTLNDLKILIGKAGINIKNETGNTPLHCAVKGRHLEMVKFLIQHGASVNIIDTYGSAALHLAVVKDALDIVEYLVEHGADVNVKDNKKITVLHLATKWSNLDAVKYLVERGANASVRDNCGRTALHLAAERGKLDIVKYLAERGVDVNVKDGRGCTALHSATESNELDTVKYLIKCVREIVMDT